MTKIIWDKVTERKFQTGVNKGVLYVRDDNGQYMDGVPWNGLTTVTESPSGAESNIQYADNIPYLNIKSAEQFGCTIEAFSSPPEFEQCDGTAEIAPGVYLHQQSRKSFGFSWQNRLGNDTQGVNYGYRINVAWGLDANPSERTHATINESPEAASLSWEVTSTPTEVGTVGGIEFMPSAKMSFDSDKADSTALAALEDLLYGTPGAEPRLPSPAEVIALFQGAAPTEVETQAPTYNAATDIVTIPAVTGVIYSVDGEDVPSGAYGPITEDVVVTARADGDHYLSETSDTDWTINFA